MTPRADYGLRLGLALLACALIAACDPDGAPPREGPSQVARDSAGVRIVESTGAAWRPADEWRLADAPDATIGDVSMTRAPGDRLPPLQRVQAVRALSDARIAVADAGSAEILVTDSAGTLLARLGGRGDGPGELPQLLDMYECADTLVAVSRSALHYFDPGGGFLRRVAHRSGGEPRRVLGVSRDCGTVLFGAREGIPEPGTVGRTRDVIAWLDPVTGAVDPVLRTGLVEVWTRDLGGAPAPFVIPWSAGSGIVVALDGVVVALGHAAELRQYTSQGALVRRLRWNAEPTPIGRAQLARYRDLRAGWLETMPPGEPEVPYLFPEVDEYPRLPTSMPVIDELLVAGDGSFWIRSIPEGSLGLFDARFAEPTWERQEWTVLDPDGRWLGRVRLPEAFALFDADNGRVYGVARDALDVQTVRSFRLMR